MNQNDLEKQMRLGECFHSIRVLPHAWTIVRVDGRSFSRFTESRFAKPFDLAFSELMVTTASALMTELNGVYGYTESDEIWILLPSAWDLFGREVEKTVSVSAGIASAAFTEAYGQAAHFDSRLWVGAEDTDVVDYFRWRQSDAGRCCLNGWVYWTLRQNGMGYEDATKASEGRTKAWKHDTLMAHGINFNDLPSWQKRGLGLYWGEERKDGLNPITGESVPTVRRKLIVDREIPLHDRYSDFIAELLKP